MSKAIVLVCFGTSNLKGLKQLEDFEEELRKEFDASYYICKCFTSGIISDILFDKYRKVVPKLEKLLFDLSNDGYKEVYIQPLHIIEGKEYISIKETIEKYKYSFLSIKLGNIIMGNNKNTLKYSCNLIAESIGIDLNKSKNIVLVGHGSKTINIESYNYLKESFMKIGYQNVFIGTLEGENKKEDILKELIKNNIEEIILAPILMLEGKHITKDIFESQASWESLFMKNNIKVTPIKKSLLEYEKIRCFYINNIRNNI